MSDGESDHDDLNDAEDIEEELKDEDESTISLYPLWETSGISLKNTQKAATMAT